MTSAERRRSVTAVDNKWLYGTFEAESPPGWLLELNRYLGDFRLLVWIYVGCAILLSLTWPVSWVIGIVSGVMASRSGRKDYYAISFQCFLATALGIVLNTIPSIVAHFSPGGFEGMAGRVENKEIAANDIQSTWKAQMFLMLIYYFCLIYQDINEQIVEVKDRVIPYMSSQLQSLHLEQAQRDRIAEFLKDNGKESGGDLVDILQILETMPGWGSEGEDGITDSPQGFFTLIHEAREKAHSQGLYGLDIYTLHQLKYHPRSDFSESERPGFLDALMEEARTSKDRCLLTFSFVFGTLAKQKLLAVLVFCFALCRTAIPRLWLHYYLRGMLFPHEPGALYFVVVGICTTFICYGLFMMVFLVMASEYKKNSDQLYLLTALISMDARCWYSEKVLVNGEYMAPEDSEKLMGRLPLLDLKASRNALAFWSLRDYVVLDRSNDRVGMQILISICILLILFNVCLAAWDLVTLPWISPFIPIVLFDIFVMGILILVSLQEALHMNTWMESHARHFNRAVHDIMITYSATLRGGGEVADDANRKDVADMKLAKKLLKSAVVMVRENDQREALLFGAEITPANLFSSAASFLVTVSFFLYKMLQSGKNPVTEVANKTDPTQSLVQYVAKILL